MEYFAFLPVILAKQNINYFPKQVGTIKGEAGKDRRDVHGQGSWKRGLCERFSLRCWKNLFVPRRWCK